MNKIFKLATENRAVYMFNSAVKMELLTLQSVRTDSLLKPLVDIRGTAGL